MYLRSLRHQVLRYAHPFGATELDSVAHSDDLSLVVGTRVEREVTDVIRVGMGGMSFSRDMKQCPSQDVAL